MPAHLEFIIFGLLVAVVCLVLLSHISRMPYPVFLVIGGLALSLIPGLPTIELPPQLVFLIFLPPLLYSAAFFSSPSDLKAQLRPIAFLSIGLVLLTSVTVAVVAHVVIGLPWSVAFVLGVVVSPTDPVSVSATAERIGLPHNIVTILEGESLINDGTALALYHTAVTAVVVGSFSILEAGLDFVLSGVGGVAIGLAIGWIISRVRTWVEDPLVETTIALFTGYATYLPAEELGASGVLAVVAAGLYLSLQSPEMTSPRNRLQVFDVLEVMDFLLNSLLFILIGLQLPAIFGELSNESSARLALYAVLVSLVVVVTRFAWTFPMAYLPRYLSRRIRERNPFPPWPQVAFVGYAGMRGAVSLAAALSLPFVTESGEAFLGRDLVIFLTYGIILVTLVLQGLSLPFFIRQVGLKADGEEQREENEARLRAAEAVLERIEELEGEEWVREDTVERMRELYEYRRGRFAARYAGAPGKSEEAGYEERSLAYQRFRREILAAERAALIQLRREDRISEKVRRRIERDLDLEEARLEI
ncbi:MAG: Na+/H+ antiporter [Rubrobacter sp.]|nr:Na+/H+ antiporter [Rubrobacter sp.]